MKRPSQQPLTGPCTIDSEMRRMSTSARLIALSVALSALIGLSGCGFWKRPPAYVKSGEIPAMKVPEGLDTPGYDPSLTVPPASGDRWLSGADLAPSPLGTSGIDGDLSLGSGRTSTKTTDTLDNAWRRVGVALDRSGAFLMQERSREQASYKIGIPAPIVRDPRPWWKRTLGWGDEPVQTSGSEVVVQLAATGPEVAIDVRDLNGAVLTDSRASRVIAILENRLGLD